MTTPVLTNKKFYIIKPYGGYNYIKNPAFAPSAGVIYWAGTQATIALTGDEQRRGSHSMKVTPVSGQTSYAAYAGLAVTAGLAYTFSCDVKGVAGQAMRIYIGAYTATTFTATGYWQRVQVTATIGAGVTTTFAVVQRDSTASAEPFYVDGVQFEQALKMSTFIEGNQPGCGWVGSRYHSTSWRDPLSAKGGLLVDLEDYCHIVQVTGLGHGDWNQILTKMTSGGDMYQTHIRKSRNFSIVVDFLGSSLGEIEANRKAIIDLIRPDLAEGQERIIRYQGVDASGVDATNPIDIRCVPLPATLTDTPDLPTYQRGILNFVIPSGLLHGAYNDGAVLDWVADFPAEFIVKRDPDGNWCKWNTGTSAYDSLITGLNGTVFCMAEGPDGKIYVGGNFTDAGGVANADYLARWNPLTEAWEAVVAGISGSVYALAFDANGDLYIGSISGWSTFNYIAKITDLSGTPTANALGTGLNGYCFSIAIAPNGDVYVGGAFTLAGGVAGTAKIAKWDGTVWTPLATGLTASQFEGVRALAFAPNGDLYIGGQFTDAAYPYLCKWNGTAFSAVGSSTDINEVVRALAFGEAGWLYVGGEFTNDGDAIANAGYIAKWSGSRWGSLGTGTNNTVYKITVSDPNQSANDPLSGGMTVGKVYVAGAFTTAGGMTLPDRVAVWSNGAWQPLDINLPGTASVRSILPASDGSLYIGGDFTTAGTSGTPKASCGIVSDRVYTLGVASASANTYPVISITGPGVLKSITNYKTGKAIMFDGLTLQAGETATLKLDPLDLQFKSSWPGRGNLMRYIVAGSDYGDFYLRPGSNALSLYVTASSTDTAANIAWTPLFWGIDGALL